MLQQIRRSAAACCAVVAVAGLAACGGSDVDEESVVRDAREGLTALGVEVKDVTCPDEVSGDTGTKFTCKVTTQDGREADIPYVVREDDVALDEAAAQAPIAELTQPAGGEAAPEQEAAPEEEPAE